MRSDYAPPHHETTVAATDIENMKNVFKKKIGKIVDNYIYLYIVICILDMLKSFDKYLFTLGAIFYMELDQLYISL